jgi:hypothetical protein
MKCISTVAPFAILLFAFTLASTGCVLPYSKTVRNGQLLEEIQNKNTETSYALEVSYSYPDLRATFQEKSLQQWDHRYGTLRETVALQYSFLDDIQEIIVGGPYFVGGLYALARDTLFFDYHEQTFMNLAYLPAILPVLQHTDVASESVEVIEKGTIVWDTWKHESKPASKGLANRTINILDANGQVLYQLTTNQSGEAYADVRDIFGLLFADKRLPVELRELVTQTRAKTPASLQPQGIRQEAGRLGEADQLNEEKKLEEGNE